MLQPVSSIGELHLDLRQAGGHRLGVRRVNAVAKHIAGNGPVNSTGIHIQIAKLSGGRPGQRALSSAGGAVDGDADGIHEKSLSCQRSIFAAGGGNAGSAAGSPGNLQVEAAGIGVYIQDFPCKVQSLYNF